LCRDGRGGTDAEPVSGRLRELALEGGEFTLRVDN
jgi:hypothetical protein